jgi:hypothetical protein
MDIIIDKEKIVSNFYWVAEFNNREFLNQFENGVEHKFQEVIHRFDELKYFTLKHKTQDISFTVEILRGIIFHNGGEYISDKFFKEEKKNIRLIYFKHHVMTLGDDNVQVFFFIGLQYNDKNGNNRKLLLQIDKDGNSIIGVE